MYFKFSGRTNPKTNKWDSYYRLVESYRNNSGRICHRTILNIGFIGDELSPIQLNQIARTLTNLYERKPSLFPQTDHIVNKWVTELWNQIVREKRVDITLYDPTNRMIDSDTIQHKQVREIGAEWMCYNTWQTLGIDKILEENEFTESEVKLSQTQVISRAVYPASELATATWIRENSAITEITGYDVEKINKDKLYRNALKLNQIKEQLEQHLSIKTNELFDIKDRIMLYDLTNTYFEGEKRNSKLAKFGRSKEKRKDCRLIVLALVVNIYGFIKHSSIHEGNFSDSKDLDKVIKALDKSTGIQKPIIVIDAGIATKKNLDLIQKKNYNYLCVSRQKIKEAIYDTSRLVTLLQTKSNQEIILKKIIDTRSTDFIVEIQSHKKAQKEQAMKTQFETRYEEELTKIKTSLIKKGGVKTTDKVNQRIGRAKQKYPSIQNRYNLKIELDHHQKIAKDLHWSKKAQQEKEANENLGKYFIRTNLDMKDEVIVWNVYNTIREIESTFRTLKTDLDLRPIYHKKDESTIAHLNLGLLSYWLVNTIRCQLKSQGIRSTWTEIVRIGNTHKVITTSGYNKAEQEITVRKCSEPEQKLKNIYLALNIKNKPFTKLKSVVHKPKLKNSQRPILCALPSG